MRRRIVHQLPCLSLALAVLLGGCGDGGAAAGDAAAGDAAPDAAAGDDGGAPDGGTPEPAYGIFQLYGDEYTAFRTQLGLSTADYWAFVDAHVATLGASFTRTNTLLIWGLVEPTVGAGYDWDAAMHTDDVVTATYRPAPGKRMDMLLVLEPARGSQDAPRYPTGLEAEYQAFVRAAVERYDGDGVDDVADAVRVEHWQVMNEPFFEIGRGVLTTAEYAALVALTAQAVREADPDARLVLGDLGQHFAEVVGLLDPSLPLHAVDSHYWAPGPAYEDPVLWPMRTALDASGRSGTEIWMCEFGTWVHQPRNQPEQTETEQARWLVKAMVANRAAGARRILWNNLVGWSSFGGDAESQFNFMGLVSSGPLSGDGAADLGRERVAYWAYQRLVAETETNVVDLIGEIGTGQASVRAFMFAGRIDGRPVLVAWDDAGAGGRIQFLDCQGSRLRVVSLVPDAAGTFQETTQDCAAGPTTVTFTGPDPILVRELE